MLTVAGTTIIGRIIDGLIENRVTDIVVVTGYRAEELTAYLTNTYPALSFTFIHNEKYRETNNIYSLALAFEKITFDSDVILIESDLIYHPQIISRLIASPYANVALVDRYHTGMDGTVVAINNDIITNIIPSHLQPESFDFSDKYKTLNIYKFSQAFCETTFKKLLVYYANVIDNNCYYELILGIIIYLGRESMHAVVVDGEQWSEVDDPNDLQVAEFAFNDKRKEILEHNFGGYWNYDVLDFCFIRNMYFPNHAIISEMRNTLPDLIRNYGSRQSVLDQKMSVFLLCRKENVIALNGAAQIYPLLGNYFAGKKALIPAPSFGEYPRCFPGASEFSDNGDGYDIKEIESKSKDADVVVIVNPNNPSGAFLASGWIYDFAARNPSKTVIADESFIEFAPGVSVLSLLEQRTLSNVIIIKSLSKSLGVPGIRLGYVYSANAGFMAFVRKNTPIWNMNSVAEYYLEIILKHRNSLKASIEKTNADRDDFAKKLASLAIVEKVFPSAGNFLMVRLSAKAPKADALVDLLLSRHSVFIKNVSSKFPDNNQYLRFAVRLPEENAHLVSLLKLSVDKA
jgi:histidinol-phosphate/aromatic aminotransferase/cobyric acid decarboxylase-like protein/CTP:phosphocholine cytidylyltransferase-like protein